MAEKASLMLEAAKKSEEIDKLEKSIAECNERIDSLPQTLEQSKRAAREKSLAAFNSRQDELRKRVKGVISKKLEEVTEYIDSLPGMEAKEFAGKLEVTSVEEQLKLIYPDDMITDYLCTGVAPLEDAEEAFAVYAEVEREATNLSNGSDLTSSMFTGLTEGLVKLIEDPRMGAKMIPIVLIFYVAGIILFPFIFLTAFSVIGILSGLQGHHVKGIINKLYSIKMFLNESYNEDLFARDREKILSKVSEFLHDVEVDYIGEISKETFEYDDSNDAALEKQMTNDIKRAQQDRDLYNGQLQKAQEELQAMLAQIDKLEEEERQRAANARKELLETITWKHEWLEHIFIDITKENKKVLLPFSKANSCYFGKEATEVQAFARITVLQCILHMHPEYASHVVLDFKYMAGTLAQFIGLKNKCISLFYTEEETKKKMTNMDNEIKARTKNILASSEDLDSFNKLMSEYGSTGEFYVVVHVFGLESISNTWKNWVRNGPRVGYIFKFYWTIEELEKIKEDLPFADLKDYFEISNTAMPRSPSAVKRILGIDS